MDVSSSFRLRLFALGLFLTYIAISWITALAEGWTAMEGLYYGVAVMTPVGFGDFVPDSTTGRIVAIVLTPVGIILGFGIGLLLLQESFMSLVQRRRSGMVPRGLKDHYIIIGYGRTGRVVADTMLKLGRGICILESDASRHVELMKRDVPFVIGSALDQENIDAARVDSCAGVVITFENDAESVYVVLEVRERRSTVPIICTASSQDSARRLQLAGATKTVLSRTVAGDMLAKAALNPEVLELVTVSGEHGDSEHTAFGQVVVTADSWLNGLELREAGSRAPGALVVLASRGDARRHAPGGDLRIEEGMMLVLVGDPEAIGAYETPCGPDEELSERLAQRRRGEV